MSNRSLRQACQHVTRLLLIAATIAGVAHGASQPTPRLWGELKPGPYGVGFRVTTYNDPDRDGTSGRPVQIALWYPTRLSKRSVPLTFADYLTVSNAIADTTPVNGSDRQTLRESLSVAISSEPEGIAGEALDQILATKMAAVKDAPLLKKSFPVVLWSARHGTIAAQSILSEYLASHGYVIGFARYQGAAMPLPFEAKTSAIKLTTLNEHIRDLEFALRQLKTLPNVDAAKKIAVVSWSYAGESATLLQAQSPDVGLVISLSSNVLNGWVYQSADEIAKLDAARLNVPYIILTERVATNGTIRTPPTILNSLPINSYFVSFPELAHGNFNATEGMIPGVMGITKVPRWSKSGAVAQMGYEAISRYTLRFLNHYLKSKTKNVPALKDLEKSEKLPPGFVVITQHGANGDKSAQ